MEAARLIVKTMTAVAVLSFVLGLVTGVTTGYLRAEKHLFAMMFCSEE